MIKVVYEVYDRRTGEVRNTFDDFAEMTYWLWNARCKPNQALEWREVAPLVSDPTPVITVTPMPPSNEDGFVQDWGGD